MNLGCITQILARFNSPAAAPPAVPLLQEAVGPIPHQRCSRLHPHVVHHPKIERSPFMQPSPILKKRIIGIHQKGVIELITQLLLQRTQT